MIMAGGKGTRLTSLTKNEIPKPMVKIAGKPILEWQIEQFRNNGITDIILAVGHLGQKIKEYFQHGYISINNDLKLIYSIALSVLFELSILGLLESLSLFC